MSAFEHNGDVQVSFQAACTHNSLWPAGNNDDRLAGLVPADDGGGVAVTCP